jgi:hypothetical protein
MRNMKIEITRSLFVFGFDYYYYYYYDALNKIKSENSIKN